MPEKQLISKSEAKRRLTAAGIPYLTADAMIRGFEKKKPQKRELVFAADVAKKIEEFCAPVPRPAKSWKRRTNFERLLKV